VFAALAPDEDMRIYDRGIRRRVPPMLEGDQRRLRLVYSLLLTLPGTPVLLYGEEIGLGDDPSVEGRGAVRVAMQWSGAKYAGFSRVEPAVPSVRDGDFGPARVNVADQRRDPESLLNWMERAIRVRKETPELGWGEWRVLDVDAPTVFAHRCDWQDGTVVVLHNLGSDPCEVTVPLEDGEQDRTLVDLLADQAYEAAAKSSRLPVAAYGYRWLRLHG
jgi:maltose alpha-D-glucosyltransferase/alpha-amylase